MCCETANQKGHRASKTQANTIFGQQAQNKAETKQVRTHNNKHGRRDVIQIQTRTRKPKERKTRIPTLRLMCCRQIIIIMRAEPERLFNHNLSARQFMTQKTWKTSWTASTQHRRTTTQQPEHAKWRCFRSAKSANNDAAKTIKPA